MCSNCMVGDGVMILNHLAEHWAGAMWRACWQGTLLIALIWAICRLFPTLPASMRYWLWWIACLKLCVGLLWVTPVALPLLPASADSDTALAMSQTADQPTQVAAFLSQSALTQAVGAWPLELSSMSILMLAWLGGVMLWLTILIRQLLALHRLVAYTQSGLDNAVEERIFLLRQQLSLRRFPPVVTSNRITSPLVTGPMRPVVVIPADITQQLSDNELDMALAHEFMHVRRGDLWWAQIPTLAQVLFFFHPLAWLAHREWVANCEAACDADTLRLSSASPADYGRVLLKLVTSERPSSVPITLGATSDYRMLENRLEGLRRYTPTAPSRLRYGIALLLLLGCIGVIPWRVTAQATADPKQTSQASYSPSANTDSAAPRLERSTHNLNPRVEVPRTESTPVPVVSRPEVARPEVARDDSNDQRATLRAPTSDRTQIANSPAQSSANRTRRAAPTNVPSISRANPAVRSLDSPSVAERMRQSTLNVPQSNQHRPGVTQEPAVSAENQQRVPMPTTVVSADSTPAQSVTGSGVDNGAYASNNQRFQIPPKNTYQNLAAPANNAINTQNYKGGNSYPGSQQATPSNNTTSYPALIPYSQQEQVPYGQQATQPQQQNRAQQRTQNNVGYGQALQANTAQTNTIQANTGQAKGVDDE